MTPVANSRMTTEFRELKQVIHDFETGTGIDIRAWARRRIPTSDYAHADSRVCERCGVRQSGRHLYWMDCVIAFREVCFNLERQIERLHKKKTRSGSMERSDNHFVVLHGERMCLADAARELGLTFDALRARVKRRARQMGDELDLDALGIDKRYARMKDRQAEVHS
jgi:hypothetical protein